VSSALPGDGSDTALIDSELADRIAHGVHVGAERGRELASTAAERSAPLIEAARKRARKRGAQLAEIARDRSGELAELARDRADELAHRGLATARRQH